MKYRNKLNSIDWDSIFLNDDINKCAEQLSEVIIQSAREAIPNKTVTIRPLEPQWINSNIKRNIRQRKRLYKKAKRLNTNIIWDQFKHKRNEVNSLIRIAKIQYKDKLAHDLKANDTNSRNWYKLTSELLTPKTDKPIPFLEVDNKIIENDHDKAEALNSYFCKQSTLDDTEATLPDLITPEYPLLEQIYITHEDVREAIALLNPNKAPGPDLISPKLLKEGTQQLVPQLQRLFNLSLSLKQFPNSWKKSNVTAIHKKDSTTNPGNYRPISLLNINGKLMERCIHKHLTAYFLENNVITPYQSGFVSGDSTINQLLYLSNEFYKALDEEKEIRIVFCDISKAFDRVWHKGLIYKLKSSGLSGPLIDWLANYLDNRQQRVYLNNCSSTWQNTNAGVPQGSILGPLLFLIFINDIVKDIRGNIKLFADDTILFEIVDEPILTGITLNIDLSRIFAWAKQWLVEFQPIKQETFIASKKRIKPYHPPLFMGNTQIKEVDSHKHLGIEFTNDMTWKKHINTIVSKAYKRLGILRMHKFNLDRRSLDKMYKIFIRPLLEYGNTVWDNCIKENKTALENIQRDAQRISSGATKLCSFEKLYNETGYETLENRRKKHRLCQMYKMTHNLTPNYLQRLLPPQIREQSRYHLRNPNNFMTPITRTRFYYSSFLPSALRDWNSLNNDSRNSTTLINFKRTLSTPGIVPSHYLNIQTTRTGQILHTRIRLECSSLNQHLYKKKLINSPNCLCGQVESAAHFLLHCPRYNQIRRRYFGNAAFPITVHNLLYGVRNQNITYNDEIFKQVQLYILASKRFT